METRKIVLVPLDQIDLGPRYAIDVHAMQTQPSDPAIRQSIDKEGLKFPVLLTGDLKLIDGLRRIQALHDLGHTKIPAFVAETFAEIIDYLAEVNQGVDVSFGRMGQIMMTVRPLMLKAAMESRMRGRWRATEPPARYRRARYAYLAAFPLSNYATVARITSVYTAAQVNNNPEAQHLVEQIEAGTMSINTAYARLYQRPFFRGDVATRSGQENLLRNTTQHLGAVIKGLTKLQSPIKVRPQVAKECLEDLRLARATLISAIRELEKETEQA